MAVAIEGGVVAVVEPEFAFAVIGILTVAVKAIFRKDRPNVAIEFKFLGRGG